MSYAIQKQRRFLNNVNIDPRFARVVNLTFVKKSLTLLPCCINNYFPLLTVGKVNQPCGGAMVSFANVEHTGNNVFLQHVFKKRIITIK